MKKLALLSVAVFCFFYLNGQKIGVFIGNNTMGFYPGVLDEEETWSHAVGNDVGIWIEDLSRDNFRIALKLDNYKGCYEGSFHSLGGGSDTHLDINKYIIALEAFPFNFSAFTNLKINIGGECSCLLWDATTGNSSSWQMGTSPYQQGTSSSKYIEKGTWDGNKRISAGLTIRFAYNFALSDEWFLVPQFSFYMGLTDEFKKSVPDRTMRTYLEIGLSKKLKQKTR